MLLITWINMARGYKVSILSKGRRYTWLQDVKRFVRV